MQLAKLAILARKIHRFLVLFVVVLGLIMMTTGLTLHEAEEGRQLFSFLDIGTARMIHSSISIIFSGLLSLMIVTGLYLFLYPWLQKITRKKVPTQ
jgi:hypothetical protein